MASTDEYDIWSAVVIAQTKKAVLLDIGGEEKWVPLSCLSDESQDEIREAEKGDVLDVEIAEWWSDKELR